VKFTVILFSMLAVLQISCVSNSTHNGMIAERDALSDKLTDAEKQLQLTLQDKDKLKQDLADLAKYKKNAEERIAEFKSFAAKFQSLIDAGKLKVNLVNGRMVVVMSTDILFQSGSSRLSSQGAKAIQEVSALLNELQDKEFQIAGHTDDIPMKGAMTNWNLASQRAYSVVKTMLAAGFPKNRISMASYADTKPAVENSSRASRALNRRIEIVVVPDLSQLPGQGEMESMFAKPAGK